MELYSATGRKKRSSMQLLDADDFWLCKRPETVREILKQKLLEPQNESEVAKLLEVKKSQAKAWLTLLVKEGIIEKLSKPSRYSVIKQEDRLL